MGECESFCHSSGFQVCYLGTLIYFQFILQLQGTVGSCNCGYIMFSKKSGHTTYQDKEMERKMLLNHYVIDRSKTVRNTEVTVIICSFIDYTTFLTGKIVSTIDQIMD